MARVDELRAAIEAGRGVLAEAIESAAERWEEAVLAPEGPEVNPGATGEAWTPRRAAEHAIGAQSFQARLIGRALERESARVDPPSLPSAGEAVRVLEATAGSWDELFNAVDDGDLAKPARLGDPQINYLQSLGVSASKTVEGALQLFAAHLEDHAQQIRSAL